MVHLFFSPPKSKDIALLEKLRDNFSRKLFFMIDSNRFIRASGPEVRNSECIPKFLVVNLLMSVWLSSSLLA